MRLFLVFVFAPLVLTCPKDTFHNTKVKSSEYFKLTDAQKDLTVSGCLTPSLGLERSVIIEIVNETIPTLEEGAVDGLLELNTLILKENGIEKIKPKVFVNLPEISHISLANNKIEEIPEGVFNGLNVKRIFLENNRISIIAPNAFKNVPELVRIDLDNNKLKNWNQWFETSPKLYLLSVVNNQLDQLPENAFKNLGINSVYPLSIYLSRNKIKTIHPSAFNGIKELQTLDLDNNKITTLEKWFSTVKKIKFLLLNNNAFSCASLSFLEELPEVEMVDLDNNQWDCDCLKKVKDWARKKTVDVSLMGSSIVCTQERIRKLINSVRDLPEDIVH